jgi:hypothetical protein
MENNQILVLRDNAKAELMQIKTVEDGITYMNKLKTIDVWVKAEKKDAELQNIIAEQKLRTQRILGELIEENQRKGLLASKGESNYNSLIPEGNKRTLTEIGLTAKQSSTFQQIATIPEEVFEEFIAEKKEAVNNAVAELTTAGAVRLAKSLDRTMDSLNEANKAIEVNDELKELAKTINLTYTKEQRRTLINLIKI